jgi:hypothetical protein
MKSADFARELTSKGQIAAPPEIPSHVPPGEPIQMVLQWGISEDEAAWPATGRRQFEAAYSADDSVWERLLHDPSAR